ncbi:MAG TPA: MFS transporter [Noviherbaspirillum sp.]|uniref:MFS transporter n=1 Tax=Noviherbaspirillum sp. TaxID=1926288 RepID=UPI002B48FFD9|nr:MFS transporter [Noviherbaspirillum sp.]HJV84513.1 MFS transporter [Noviherbaspirillum sp.]
MNDMNVRVLIPASGRIRQDSPYAWYVVYLLTFAYTVAFIDRQVLNLLVDPIKRDMLLTDVQISLLQGFSFMTAYVIFGPIFGVALWSCFTILCGMTHEYWQLFLTRAGVGAAEACLAPAGFSLIADYFSRKRLPRAMSIFMLGPSLGAGLALIAGGLVIGAATKLGQIFPILASLSTWQLTFVMVGVPGLLLAAALLTVREPARTSMLSAARKDEHFTARETIAFFWEHRAFYLRYFIGLSLLAIVIYGFPTWMPAYLMRHFGADPASVGLRYGTQVLILGAIGIYSGPWVERWLTARGYRDAPVRCPMLCAVVVGLLCIAIPFVDGYEGTLAVAGMINLLYALPWAVAASALQISTPNRMRGIAVSIFYFLVSVFGLGIAPSIIAFVTDHVLRDTAKVGTSLAIVCCISALGAAWLLSGAMKHYKEAAD